MTDICTDIHFITFNLFYVYRIQLYRFRTVPPGCVGLPCSIPLSWCDLTLSHRPLPIKIPDFKRPAELMRNGPKRSWSEDMGSRRQGTVFIKQSGQLVTSVHVGYEERERERGEGETEGGAVGILRSLL